MESFKYFLENSSIHGLNYISSRRKWSRIFWVIVVILGFVGAGILIYQSFDVWSESPVKTTIETLPIHKIKLPKVTVCPPKHTYTNLNYDLTMTANIILDNETRNELSTIVSNYGNKNLTSFIYSVFENHSLKVILVTLQRIVQAERRMGQSKDQKVSESIVKWLGQRYNLTYDYVLHRNISGEKKGAFRGSLLSFSCFMCYFRHTLCQGSNSPSSSYQR